MKLSKYFCALILMLSSITTFSQSTPTVLANQTSFESNLIRTKDDVNITYEKIESNITVDFDTHQMYFFQPQNEWIDSIYNTKTIIIGRNVRTLQVWTNTAYYEFNEYKVDDNWVVALMLEWPYEGIDQRKYTMTDEGRKQPPR
jgi:hypothetical protein